jgi:hypothetical protein
MVMAAVAVLSTAPVRAQSFEAVGIRARGMGGAFVAVADDATASWWNPAGLADGPYLNALVQLTGTTDVARIDSRAFAVAFPALGLSYYRVPIVITRPGSPLLPASANGVSGDLSVFGATVEQSVGEHLVVGSTLKLVRALDETHADADIGAMVSVGAARFGVAVKNLARPDFSDGVAATSLPRQARAGASFRSGPPNRPVAIFAVDMDLTRTPTPSGDARRVAAGLELWVPGRRVAVRGGAGASTTGDARRTASVGASLAVTPRVYADFQGTRAVDDIGTSWGCGLRVTF